MYCLKWVHVFTKWSHSFAVMFSIVPRLLCNQGYTFDQWGIIMNYLVHTYLITDTCIFIVKERDLSFPPNPVMSGFQTIQLLVKRMKKVLFSVSEVSHKKKALILVRAVMLVWMSYSSEARSRPSTYRCTFTLKFNTPLQGCNSDRSRDWSRST